MYSIRPPISMGLKTVYMFVTYILWGSVCYTAANILRLHGFCNHRRAWRAHQPVHIPQHGCDVAGILISVVSPLILFVPKMRGAGRHFPSVTLMAVIFGVCAMICYLQLQSDHRAFTSRLKRQKKAPASSPWLVLF